MQQCSNSNGVVLQIPDRLTSRTFGYNEESRTWGSRLQLRPEINKWLVEQKIQCNVGCNANGYFALFEDKQKAMMFKLKWC